MKDALGHGSNPGAHTTGIQKAPQLQRRHFEAIAADLKGRAAGETEVNAMADKLATTNPGFNRMYFLHAAMGGDYTFKGPGKNAAAVAKKAAKFSGAARADAAGSPNYRGSGTGPGGIGDRKLTPRKIR